MQKDDLTKIVGLLYIVIGLLFTFSYRLNVIGASTSAVDYSVSFQLVDAIMRFGGCYLLMLYGLYKVCWQKSNRE